MDNTEKKLIKRKTVYLQQPSIYGLSGCQCGNVETQWSEYEKHVWCDKCEIDFEPEEQGVFGHPVGVRVTTMLGLYFHRLNLETNEVEAFITKGYYVKAINFYLNFNFADKIEVLLPQDDLKLKAILDLSDFSLKFKSGVVPAKYNRFELTTLTISCHKQLQEWSFPIVLEKGELKFVEDDNFKLFKKFVLNQKLEWALPETNKGKPNKI